MTFGSFNPGQRVVTRRGRIGVVQSIAEDGTVLVRFGCEAYPMRPGQLVTESAYSRMQAGARYGAYATRLGMRP